MGTAIILSLSELLEAASGAAMLGPTNTSKCSWPTFVASIADAERHKLLRGLAVDTLCDDSKSGVQPFHRSICICCRYLDLR